MRIIVTVIIGIALLAGGGCLSRKYYFEPTEKTLTKGEDGLVRGAVQAEGSFPVFSDAPGKNFANPSFSVIGK
ncbi:MAG: hypothetical protein PHH77_04570 [Victivallaceae bacterium]|nr:hypothetical protein [Victivallaceae bacterium]